MPITSKIELTREGIEEIILKHRALWKVQGPDLQWRYDHPDLESRYRRKHVFLMCKGCGVDHWVSYEHLRQGRSRSCQPCSKKKSPFYVSEVLKKHNSLWSVPFEANDYGQKKLLPLEWKTDDLRQKYVMLTCKCKTKQWVRWGRVQQGEARGCRSCQGKQTYKERIKDPLYSLWWDLVFVRNQKQKHMLTDSWRTFEVFEEWARPIFSPGWTLRKKDKTLPYGPDNCDFFPKKVYVENRREEAKELSRVSHDYSDEDAWVPVPTVAAPTIKDAVEDELLILPVGRN